MHRLFFLFDVNTFNLSTAKSIYFNYFFLQKWSNFYFVWNINNSIHWKNGENRKWFSQTIDTTIVNTQLQQENKGQENKEQDDKAFTKKLRNFICNEKESIKHNVTIKTNQNPILSNQNKIINYTTPIQNCTYYNFDPNAKTKKIQIYFNCEMYDMIRKIKKIETFLTKGFPVDILFIYTENKDSDYENRNEKKKEKENKNNDKGNNDDNKAKKIKKKKSKKKEDLQISKFIKFNDYKTLEETKYSVPIVYRINFILNHLRKIAAVDQMFRHIENKNHIIMMKLYPKQKIGDDGNNSFHLWKK